MRYSYLCPIFIFWPAKSIRNYVGNHFDVVACISITRPKHLQHKIYSYFKSLNSLNIFLCIENVMRVNFKQRNFLRKHEFLCYKNPFSVFYE